MTGPRKKKFNGKLPPAPSVKAVPPPLLDDERKAGWTEESLAGYLMAQFTDNDGRFDTYSYNREIQTRWANQARMADEAVTAFWFDRGLVNPAGARHECTHLPQSDKAELTKRELHAANCRAMVELAARAFDGSPPQ